MISSLEVHARSTWSACSTVLRALPCVQQARPAAELGLAAHAEPAALKKAGLLRPADASAYSLVPAPAAAPMNGAAAASQVYGAASVAEGAEGAEPAVGVAGSGAAATNGGELAEGTGLGSGGDGKLADSTGAVALKVEVGGEGAQLVGGGGRAEVHPRVVSEVTSGRVKVPRGGFAAAFTPP